MSWNNNNNNNNKSNTNFDPFADLASPTLNSSSNQSSSTFDPFGNVTLTPGPVPRYTTALILYFAS